MNEQNSALLLAIFCFHTVNLASASASPTNSPAVVLEIKDTITTATAELVEEAVKTGSDTGAEVIVVMLDTPGGQLDAAIRIVESIERSSIPVVSFVHPNGAKAWSAGALILVGSHIAAMAPYTVVGSAQPVGYSPFGGTEPVTDRKVVNALSLFIAERARMHGRNETAARLFVEENLNLNSAEAQRLEVVEVLASDLDELLTGIDGTTVTTMDGPVILQTREASILMYSPSLRVGILAAISNPLLAYLLFTIGLYALIFGLASPGYGGEVIGAVALLTGLIGMGFEVDLGALLILCLGAVLMIAEAYTPGFGLLGGAGLFCLIAGSLLLIPFAPARWLIDPGWYEHFVSIALGVAAVIGGFTLLMVYKILQARRRKPLMGGLVGVEVEAVDEIGGGKTGFVRFTGEYWKARSTQKIRPGEKALVVGKGGPILIVEPAGKGREQRTA